MKVKVQTKKQKQFEEWVGSDIGRISYTFRSFSNEQKNPKSYSWRFSLPWIECLDIGEYNSIVSGNEKIWDTFLSRYENRESATEAFDIMKKRTKENSLPEILHCHVGIKIKIKSVYFNGTDFNPLFIFELPCGHDSDQPCCTFFWLSMPVNCKDDIINYCKYHDISVAGRNVTQPRYTACFGSEYKFSGKIHPVEKQIPEKIKNLMSSINDSGFLDNNYQVNMCLVNHYPTGRHCIGEHSDNEKEMLNFKDVFCFCEGDTRELVLRRTGKSTKKQREILRINIPTGLYVMSGLCFQKHYTHEFPELNQYFFKKLQLFVQESITEFPDYPRSEIQSDSGANRLGLEQAMYIKTHANRIKYLL